MYTFSLLSLHIPNVNKMFLPIPVIHNSKHSSELLLLRRLHFNSLALCINPPPTASCEIFHLVLVFVLQHRSECSQSILLSSDLPDFLTSTLPFPSTVLWNKLKTGEIFHYLVDFAVFKTDTSTSFFCLSTAVLPLFWKGTYNIVFQGFTTKGKLLGQNLYSSFTIQTAFLKPSCSQCPLQTVAQLEWLLALDSWLPTFYQHEYFIHSH